MDLTINYLGLELSSPLMCGASPMVDNLDTVRRLVDAGCSAIVMHSLFEEQITREQLGTFDAVEGPADSYAEALSYLPSPHAFALGPEAYLEQIRRIKQAVGVPVIASLNGTTPGGWLSFAKLIEAAGADALELNVYEMITDLQETAQLVEDKTLAMVRQVSACTRIPIAVKLSPFYTALPSFARELVDAGADGLVLFNRFYQPDVDLETMEVIRLNLSDRSELLLRLRWLAILSGRVEASLGVTGGVHTAVDAIKTIMTGAHAVQMVSALLRHGPEYLATVKKEMVQWMEKNEYPSIKKMQGCMNLLRCPDPRSYERANYVQLLQSRNG